MKEYVLPAVKHNYYIVPKWFVWGSSLFVIGLSGVDSIRNFIGDHIILGALGVFSACCWVVILYLMLQLQRHFGEIP